MPREEDHFEFSLSPDLAAATDRGLRRDRNEDRFAIGRQEGFSVLIVCDGVSSSVDAERASAAAAETASAALLQASTLDAGAAMRCALDSAARRVAALPSAPHFIHARKGRRVNRICFALGLRSTEPIPSTPAAFFPFVSPTPQCRSGSRQPRQPPARPRGPSSSRKGCSYSCARICLARSACSSVVSRTALKPISKP